MTTTRFGTYRPILGLLVAVFVASGSAACSLLEQAGWDSDEPPPALELSSTEAPPNTNFSSVRALSLEFDLLTYEIRGSRVYLKISDPRVGQLFLGRVSAKSRATIELSVLRATQELDYELYDESGWNVQGRIAIQ